MDQLSIAFLSVLFLIVSIIWIKKSPSLPPGPAGLPIVGYLPFLGPDLHLQLTSLARKYGPIYKLWLGSKLCVVITSPDLIKQVVRDHDTVFANHDPTVAGLVATGGLDILNSPYGPYWRSLRKLFVREMMSNSSLEASYALRKGEVRRAVGNVRRRVGSAVDVGELIFVTELNVILSLLWGGTIRGDDERDRMGAEFREKVEKFVELLGKANVSDVFPILARFDLQGVAKEMRGVLPSVDEILDSVIRVRFEGEQDAAGRRGKDFVQILLDLKEEQAMDLTRIKALLMDIVIGGTDTSATIVEWVMAELLDNPHVTKRVQQELTDVVGLNNIVEETHMSQLKYLEAVVKETFRLHPPLPLLIPRLPSQSTLLAGYTIPKNSRVVLNVWANYKDPQVWRNPSQFRPDRFLNDGGAKFDYMGNNYHYLPFGSGRRVCPGVPLAEKMVMYLLATMLHSFDWELPEGEKVDLSEKFGIVMKKSTPLLAVPSPRLPGLSLYE
ncbi:cytochrome p450 93a3 [Phtheirospermum japonicum]|uniref:Cytochrome p450 93a3 n=1 Tax=Phtheirospermum japonicum TaxID=374723 RepID=A0A830BIC5_9LAMI|nr:cytochrome p450 93a3 [Phtheirospermum japonicum]